LIRSVVSNYTDSLILGHRYRCLDSRLGLTTSKVSILEYWGAGARVSSGCWHSYQHLDYRCYDVVERQYLDPIVFLDGGRHASGVCNIRFMRVLTFLLRDDRFMGVYSEIFFVFLEDEHLVFRPCDYDIIVDRFWRDGNV
jgi:hypothetical protein